MALRVTGDPDPANNGLFTLHSDHLGSVSAMSDENGALVPGSLARYTPFGGWRTKPTAGLTDRGFTGHKSNNLGGGADDLGLIYMNARFYVPYTVGAEDLLFFDTGEVAAFSFSGTGGGHGVSADIGYYSGFVWNLDCVDCYSGDFSTLSVDFSPIVGAEITAFWVPGGDTWGIAGAPSTSLSASVTRYDTYYTRLDKH